MGDAERPRRAVFAALAVWFGTGCLLNQGCTRRAEQVTPGKFPEQLVYVWSKDEIRNGGCLFTAPKDSTRSTAVIWIHGWGVNFYDAAYVKIGRALSERGVACISANTRMHDIGTVAGYRNGKRIRGGGYWGIPSEEVLDVAAWTDFAGKAGYKNVVLAGHSAGWAAVRAYQAERQDPRVAGLIFASGQVAPGEPPDAKMLAEAKRLVANGRGDDLLRFPDEHRSYPSFISAATYLDMASGPPELGDFFGIRTPNPAVARVRCPILAWFGTKDDVGTAKDLDSIKAAIQRQSSGPRRVDTVLIQNGDHMYLGEEKQVADVVAHWVRGLSK